MALTSEAPVATPESVLPAPEEELRMAATLAAVEPAASRRRRSVDPRRTRMAAVYLPLYQDTPSLAVSLTCAHKDP
jgi:hypothetical protein